MKEWTTYKLKDICIKITDGSHFSPTAREDGYPMFSVKDMEEYGFNYASCKRISLEDFNTLKANDCVPQKGDILVAKDGSFLKQIFVCNETKEEAILSSIAIFRPNPEYVLPEFLCYILKSPKVYNYISQNCVSGSALPRIVLKAFKEVEVSIPSIAIQKWIISKLIPIDQKIQLNRQINDNLEQQAQALYKSWFVDFEPFKDGHFVESELGPIPEGWSTRKVGELPLYISDYVSNGSFASLKENVTLYETPNYAQFIRNTDLKSSQFSVWVDQASYNFLAKSKLDGGEIIISNVGDVGSVHLCPKLNIPMTLGNNVIMVKPTEIVYNYFIYMTYKWFYGKNLIKGITGGSAMPKFNKTDFKSLTLIIPDNQTLQSFDSIVSHIFEQIINLNSSNQYLSQTRDTLLPKLMSGELKINEIDC